MAKTKCKSPLCSFGSAWDSQDFRIIPGNDDSIVVPTLNEFIAGICKMEARCFPTQQMANEAVLAGGCSRCSTFGTVGGKLQAMAQSSSSCPYMMQSPKLCASFSFFPILDTFCIVILPPDSAGGRHVVCSPCLSTLHSATAHVLSSPEP